MTIWILRIRHNRLCEIEAGIRMRLNEARPQYMKPTEEVLFWLQNVETLHKQVDSIERSFNDNSTSCFSSRSSLQKFSGLIEEMINEINRLVQRCSSKFGLVVLDEVQFQQLAFKMTLVGTSAQNNLGEIWVNLNDPRIGVIGIYGIGGVGKTTIMTNVKNALVASNLFDKILWVTVSKESSYGKIQNEIASQLNLDLRMSENQSDDSVAYQATKLLKRLQKIKKFVIIFDDIWHKFSLKTLGIPEHIGETERKVVLISRSREVCQEMKATRLFNVETLHPEEAWDLFVSKAGNIVFTPEIRPCAKHVVKECRGVPILIVSIGLALKDEASIQVWITTLAELRTPVISSEDGVILLLRFSYNRLRSDTMKKCFLYCALFPEDYLFKPDELIRYWMAEGFIHKDGDMVTEIDDGFKIMSTLVDANMLEMFTKNEDDWVQMHDLFRDMAIQIMLDDRTKFWIPDAISLLTPSFNVDSVRAATKLSLMSNGIEYLLSTDLPTKIILEHSETVGFTLPNLSTLLLRDNPIRYILNSLFTQMLSLKFLDISYCSRIRKLPSSLSELVQLRALFLQYCTSLKKIPSLKKMKDLQYLSLRGTSIAQLPRGMERLSRLRSLDLSETTKLVKVGAGVISSLTRLEELRMQGCGLCLSDTPILANILMEMRCLNRLKILMISSVSFADLLDTIVCLQNQNLKIFSINAYGSTDDYNENEETT